jgi:precorrin-3B C17-methyltransferase
MKLSVVGIGVGHEDYVLPLAVRTIAEADVVIGYHGYFPFIDRYLTDRTQCIGKDLGEEEERAHLAVELAEQGNRVVVIGSGDASIYAMASLVYEHASRVGALVPLETIPGISAFLALGSKLGAVLGHDFCCLSLSDLMTPWTTIEKRIRAAAVGDFVTNVYNPKSHRRYWQLVRFKEIFMEQRAPDTPVAIGRQVGREDERITLTTLAEFDPDAVDMFSLVVVGNSQTFRFKQHLVTPRGYLDRKPHTGKEIQRESFRQIIEALKSSALPPDLLWACVRCVHTAGDMGYAELLEATPGAIGKWHEFMKAGGEVVTDVTMVQAGITQALASRYGTQVHCYLNDEKAVALAGRENLTRSQAGIRIAMKKHPSALFVIGNAPTALIELADAIKLDGFKPAGVIAVPVGFVNVIESKERIRACKALDYVLLRGRRGGSNIAAALVNAVLSLDDFLEEV